MLTANALRRNEERERVAFEVVALLGGSNFRAVLLSLIAPVLALILASLPGTQAALGRKR
jgi:hypothetical protein